MTQRLHRGRGAAACAPRAAQPAASGEHAPQSASALSLARRAAVAAAVALTLLQPAPAALASKPRSVEAVPTVTAVLTPTKGNEKVSGTVTIGEATNARGRKYIRVRLSHAKRGCSLCAI